MHGWAWVQHGRKELRFPARRCSALFAICHYQTLGAVFVHFDKLRQVVHLGDMQFEEIRCELQKMGCRIQAAAKHVVLIPARRAMMAAESAMPSSPPKCVSFCKSRKKLSPTRSSALQLVHLEHVPEMLSKPQRYRTMEDPFSKKMINMPQARGDEARRTVPLL